MQRLVVILTTLAILGLVNWSIYSRERHLAEGRIVYLELAPVDPRSLMQGDYMALRFSLADDMQTSLATGDNPSAALSEVSGGQIIARLDDRAVASFGAFYDGSELPEKTILLSYRIRNGAIKFATNAYFFQEGHTEYYETARFGLFRVNRDGDLLVSMHDADLKKLGPPAN